MTRTVRPAAGGVSRARLALRAASTAPVVSAVVLVLVALIAFAGAALPALLDGARTATVQAALGSTPQQLLDPTGTVRGPVIVGDVPGGAAHGDTDLGEEAATWGAATSTLERIRREQPQPLRRVLAQPQAFVALDGQPAVPVDRSARPMNRVQVTLDPRVTGRVHVVEGAVPEAAPDAAPTDDVQVMISQEASAALDWPVGERRTIALPSLPITVVVSGVYVPDDAADPAWTHEPTGLHVGEERTGGGDTILLAAVYAAPTLLKTIAPWGGDASTTAWLPLRVDRISGTQASTLAAQLRRLAAQAQPFPVQVETPYAPMLTLGSTAPTGLDAGAARGDAMVAVVTLAAIGPLTVALAAIAMTGRLLASRRVASVRTLRARGASVPLLAGFLAAEGLVLGALGAVLGALLARGMFGWAGPVALLVPVLAALAPAVSVPIAALGSARHSARRDIGVADRATRRRRLLLEGAVVGVAAAVIVLAVVQPVRVGHGGTAPVLLAVPVALFAIGCVVVLRLVPPVLVALEALLTGGRGVMARLGPAQARRGRALPLIPVLAALVCAATAMFAGVATATLTSGIDQTARAQTGADLRLTAPLIDAAAQRRIADLPGVHAVAGVYSDVTVPAQADRGWISVTVYAVDPAELAAVQKSIADAVPLPADLSDTTGDAVPAVVSDAVAAEIPSGVLTIRTVDVDAKATAESVPFGPSARWIIVDRANAQRLTAVPEATHTLLVALDADADPTAVARAATAMLGSGAASFVPAQVAAGISADPALQAIRWSLVVALAAVIVLLVVAASMTLLRGGPERGRILGLLAAMGYPRGRELPLVMWEVGPALLLALPVGLAAGYALPALLLPTIDLTRFVGGRAQPPIVFAGWMPWVVAGGFVVITALAVGVAAAVAARVTAVSALRRIDEEVET